MRARDGGCLRRGRGLGLCAATVEGRRLLDRMPLLLVLRDHAGETVLVRPESAILFIWSTLLDADPGDEEYALKLLNRDGTGSARFRTLVVRIEAKRAVENGFKDKAVGIRHPLLSIGGAR